MYGAGHGYAEHTRGPCGVATVQACTEHAGARACSMASVSHWRKGEGRRETDAPGGTESVPWVKTDPCWLTSQRWWLRGSPGRGSLPYAACMQSQVTGSKSIGGRWGSEPYDLRVQSGQEDGTAAKHRLEHALSQGHAGGSPCARRHREGCAYITAGQKPRTLGQGLHRIRVVVTLSVWRAGLDDTTESFNAACSWVMAGLLLCIDYPRGLCSSAQHHIA